MPTKQNCDFRKLDSFTFSSQVTLIKLDVEGMELDVSMGGSNLLRSNFPPIMFEIREADPRGTQLLAFYRELGYVICQYADMDYLAQHPLWETEIKLIVKDGAYSYQRIR